MALAWSQQRGATWCGAPCFHVQRIHRAALCTKASGGSYEGVTGPQGRSLPENWTQVRAWAREKFRELSKVLVSGSPAPPTCSLAQACLLIALEEEAAVEAAHPELWEFLLTQTNLQVPTRAGAATWSLSRLDALSQQVYDLIMSGEDTHQHTQIQQQSGNHSPQPTSTEQLQSSGGPMPELQVPYVSVPIPLEGLLLEPDTQGGVHSSDSIHAPPASRLACTSPHLPQGLFESEPMRVLDAINTVLFDWHGYGPCNRYGNPRDSQLSSVLEGGLGCSPALSILYLEVASRLGIHLSAVPLEEGRYWLLTPSNSKTQLRLPSQGHVHQQPQPLSTPDQGTYVLEPTTPPNAPMTVSLESQPELTAIGQQPPELSRLQGIVEQGMSPQGVGQAGVVDESGSSSPAGGRLLIDAYGRGGLLTEDEVCQLFGVTSDDLSHIATPQQLLSCVLSDLRDAYWCKSVGCSPAPAVMIPLSLATALENRVGGATNTHAMGRAVAAQQKITWLLPNDKRAQLQLALLHYFAREWDDAWLELGLFLERKWSQGREGQRIPGDETSTPDVKADDGSDGVCNETLAAAMLLEKIRLRMTLTV